MNFHPRSAARIAACLLLASAWTASEARGAVPTEQIRATVDEAVGILKDPKLKLPARLQDRREQLKQILYARFDFTEMARRSLGANWRRRTPQEQEEFVRLFTDVLERAYAGIIESYTNEKIIYLYERVDGTYADVGSKILTARGEEFSIYYKVHLVGEEWKIYDVVAENISLVNNYRSQFSRVIANGSYEELVRRLKERAAISSAPKK